MPHEPPQRIVRQGFGGFTARQELVKVGDGDGVSLKVVFNLCFIYTAVIFVAETFDPALYRCGGFARSEMIDDLFASGE